MSHTETHIETTRLANTQGLTIDLKRVYLSMYAFKYVGICHVQGKNYEKLNKQHLRFYIFFLILVTQNHSSAFLTITIILFYLRQATICLLRLFENSYDQKYIFAEDFQRQFNTNFLIINLALLQTKYFPNQYFIMFK